MLFNCETLARSNRARSTGPTASSPANNDGFHIIPEGERKEGYLKSLSPSEELAVFLSIRGMCFRDLGKPREAAEAFALAVRFAPAVHEYKAVLAQLQNQSTTNRPQNPNEK